MADIDIHLPRRRRPFMYYHLRHHLLPAFPTNTPLLILFIKLVDINKLLNEADLESVDG